MKHFSLQLNVVNFIRGHIKYLYSTNTDIWNVMAKNQSTVTRIRYKIILCLRGENRLLRRREIRVYSHFASGAIPQL